MIIHENDLSNEIYTARRGVLVILRVLGTCCPQGNVFHNFFKSGKGAVFSPTVWQVLYFDPGLIPKFWQEL